MTIEKSRIELIEELNLNAWPALSQIVVDGWVVRFAQGYTRRANSANALRPSCLAPKVLLSQFEAHFRRQKLRCAVRITPLVPASFVEELDARDYTMEGETMVMLAPIPLGTIDPTVEIASAPSQEWLAG